MNLQKIQTRYLDTYGGERTAPVLGIVIHSISAMEHHPDDPLNFDKIFKVLNRYHVSSDYIIDREGGITQLIPTKNYACHAGISQMPTGEFLLSSNHQPSVNELTIGIELIATETSGFTQLQYKSCADLCKALMEHHPQIDKDHIVGHEHVAPGRKTDPGPLFDWGVLFDMVDRGPLHITD